MIYLTQLIYLHPGKEAVFEEFEAIALGLLSKHRGELTLRIRPNDASIVASEGEVPYEVHLVRFETDEDFQRFAADPERQRFLALKQESVRASLLLRGTAV